MKIGIEIKLEESNYCTGLVFRPYLESHNLKRAKAYLASVVTVAVFVSFVALFL